MPRYLVKLTGREEVAEGTMAFQFEKPSGFRFTAGQYLMVKLIDPPETDPKGDTRVFSIASAPLEPTLMMATRMRDTAFKRVLKAVPLGTEVEVRGPSGAFVLHADATRPAVFLMGGIGITPARSIIVQATREKLLHRIVLFYSNRRPEDGAFLDELTRLAQENPNYTCVGTMTDMQESTRPWQGETGFITPAMLTKYVQEVTSPVYYMAGPPAMVTAMRSLLRSARVSDGQIRSEEFGGY